MAAQPIKIAILAMGGEGGGVLADWLVDLAEHEGFLAQSTSVPGVAQRTGATIYCVEIFPAADAEAEGRAPVFALMPMPGDVDVVAASELMEAGRAVQRGLVTADRTTLVASTHRVFSMTEKTALGDGRVSSEDLLAGTRAAAARFVGFDMAAVAAETKSAISAVLFGALAGAGALPFPREAYERTIERGGVGVAASLRAFAVAFGRAAEESAPAGDGAAGILRSAQDDMPVAEGMRAGDDGRAVVHPDVQRLLDRIAAWPPAAAALAREGIRRCIDWQDPAEAALYLDRLDAVRAVSGDPSLAAETARHLALWMTYEDTIRVASLKTRATRFDRVRDEVRAAPAQVLAIDEYLHPRLEEIAESLPGWLGRRVERPGWLRRRVERATTAGRVVTTTSLGGFLMLRAVAGLRRWRRSTLRYAAETARIESWLGRIVAAARSDPVLAVEVARCQRLVKGYGDTHARGLASYAAVVASLDDAAVPPTPARLRRLREAALADDRGDALRAALAEVAPAEVLPIARQAA